MIYKVKLKEEADTDVYEVFGWYESKQVKLGLRFLDELEEYITILEKEPQLFQIRKSNLRYCPLKHFPYGLVYEIEKHEVIIYAVFNTYQHPLRLDKRK
jgi:mRNA-degrading endonuclease RelE of RelBE toxin-antitoxin system